MRRALFVLGLLALATAACSRTPSTGIMELPKNPTPAPQVQPGAMGVGMGGGGARRVGGGFGATLQPPEGETPPASTPTDASGLADPEQRARYDAAVSQGVELMADKKWTEALAAFEAAGRIVNTDLVRASTERIQRRIDQEASAEQTADSIQTILDDGKPDEASKLAGEALKEFGATDAADKLIKLKRQADALVNVQVDDRKTRFERYRTEYEAAEKTNNKRAALLAVEQALQNGEDEALKAKYDALTADIARYDDLRTRAAELRRDPGQIEEAVAALDDAVKIWDNLVVRQELDECRVALQARRPRLGVLDFEVRGDVAIPQAGAFVADEILPAFKGSYSLVERGQINKVIEELKLQGDANEDEATQKAIEKATKVRFLVVGSVTPIAGITVQARLIDVTTGLVVQTAKVSAATTEALAKALPQLAQDLMMDDETKAKAEAQREKDAAEVEALKPGNINELIAPPEPLLPEVPLPAPIIPPQPKRPALGDLGPAQFENLPPAPPAGQEFVLPLLAAERELEMRRRAFFVAIELGDNQFRRRHYRDAFGHYEFAFNLFPDSLGVRLRLERCRLLLPPVGILPIRRRVAVLDFIVVHSTNAVPAYLGWWTPVNLSPYLAPELAVVDRSEIYWWMARLGITPRDLLIDPVARLYFARALGIRYLLFGSVVETASFNVTTYLVDAEYGYLTSSARIHVRNALELKWRLSELAWLTKLAPEQRRRIEDDNAQWALLMNDIRAAQRQNRHAEVIALCNKGLQLRPGNVELQVHLRDATRAQQVIAFKLQRDQDLRLRNQSMFASGKARDDLSRQIDAARALNAAADRQRIEAQRRTAAEDLVRRAQLMIQAKRFSVGIQLFESAVALRPNDDATYRELALARARAEEAARADAAEARARREAELRRKREAELIAARQALDAERKQREADELARRKASLDRDGREADRLLTLAQQLSAKQQYDQAVAAAQKAKQLRPTPEAERLVSQLLIDLARANAEKRGAGVKADLEKQLAAERQGRLAAEAEADRNRKLYEAAVAEGQRMLAQQKFDEAQEQFLKARKVYDTDVVLTGLNQVKAGKARLETKLAAEKQKSAELQRQNDSLKAKLADAQTALAAKQFQQAVTLYREAKRIAPTNVDVLTGLAKAEQAHEQEVAKARREGDDKSKVETFKRSLASGKKLLEQEKYEAAVVALREAVRLMPGDKDAKALLAQAEAKLGANASAMAKLKEMADEYKDRMRDGRNHMTAKRYQAALNEFSRAKALVPGDEAAAKFAAEAKQALDDEQAMKTKAASVNELVARARTALNAGKLEEARAAYTAAAKLDANNPAVTAVLADIRKAQDAANAAAKMTEQKEKVKQLLLQARAAMTAKRFDDAAKLIEQADVASPRDAAVAQARVDLAKARDEMAGAAAAKKKQDFDRLMLQGRTALQAKKYADATKAFEAALNLFPQSADAARALAEAKKGPPSSPMPPANPPGRPMPPAKPAYTQGMTQGAAQEKAGRYDAALLAYKAALQAVANDADAKAKVDFCQAMVDADKAMRARKYADARTAYETALKLFPNDFNAKAGLQRAKTAK